MSDDILNIEFVEVKISVKSPRLETKTLTICLTTELLKDLPSALKETLIGVSNEFDEEFVKKEILND